MIGKLLGHSQMQTTQRYAHLMDSPLRAGVDTVASLLRPRPGDHAGWAAVLVARPDLAPALGFDDCLAWARRLAADLKGRSRRRLNPLFVGWLMGWPIGHALCACSAMEFIHWQQHMRGALSQLPMASGPWIWLPTDQAQLPAQMSLFEGMQP